MTKKFETVAFYRLEEYDGGDGRGNQPTGLITKSKSLAEAWEESGIGRSVSIFSGTIIDNLGDLDLALKEIKRLKAIAKLTQEERELLGLA